MRFDQQGQNLFLHLHGAGGWDLLDFQSRLQSLCSFHLPSIQGLTRDLMRATQLAQQPMGWLWNQQLTDPLASLLCCATMVHVSSLRTVFLLFVSPSLSGTLLATFPSIVTVLHALFEPCLMYDTLTYDTNNLGLLIERVGVDRLVMGTDYPFPLREVPPGVVVDAVDTIRSEEREAILGYNALRFLHCSGTSTTLMLKEGRQG